MLRDERQKIILEILENERKIIAKELSTRLKVSEDTIRRDLREMDKKGLLNRVHGGAFPITKGHMVFSERMEESSESKEMLAKKGVQLIKEDMVIIIDGGTANLLLAREIPLDFRGTIITNSPTICLELSSHDHVHILMIGGSLFKESLVNVGVDVVDSLKRIRADLCFLGLYALHPEYGMTIPHLEESFVKRQMIESSNKVASLITKNKLNTISNYVSGSISDLDYLITDDEITDYMKDQYRKFDIEIL